MNNCEKYLEKIIKQNNELRYSIMFHDTIRGGWFPSNQGFSLGRGALDYAAMYVLYRILDQCNPNSILEIGMGQSTKLISYYNINNQNSHHRCVENDELWIKFFTDTFTIPNNTEVVHLNITQSEVIIDDKKVSGIYHYENFKEKLEDRKYDLMMIDGPYGMNFPEYSRIDLLQIIPTCLDDNFVIFMHDIYRKGEQRTMQYVEKVLKASNISYRTAIYENTEIIVSTSNKFLCTL